MIEDLNKIILTPGNKGENCLGNGNHYDTEGHLIEICCDECDFLLCCLKEDCDCKKYNNNYCQNKKGSCYIK